MDNYDRRIFVEAVHEKIQPQTDPFQIEGSNTDNTYNCEPDRKTKKNETSN